MASINTVRNWCFSNGVIMDEQTSQRIVFSKGGSRKVMSEAVFEVKSNEDIIKELKDL